MNWASGWVCPCMSSGDFVRDLLLGIDNLDVDLVVEGDGIVFARALAKEHGRETQST